MKTKQNMLLHELATYNAICYIKETYHPTNLNRFIVLLKEEMESRNQLNYYNLCEKQFIEKCILNVL